jgi:hypothetical protein
MLLEHFGGLIGATLLLGVTACAVLLARQAARNVEQFREDRHERFRGRP